MEIEKKQKYSCSCHLHLLLDKHFLTQGWIYGYFLALVRFFHGFTKWLLYSKLSLFLSSEVKSACEFMGIYGSSE